MNATNGTLDYVVIGSGFGGSVSAMRLVEKGYSVLVLERGKRFRDADFAKTNWRVWKYLWLPPLRCFGILQITAFRNVLVLHGCGVGGGSLGYANVLMEPDDKLFDVRPGATWPTGRRSSSRTTRPQSGCSASPATRSCGRLIACWRASPANWGAARPSERPTWALTSARRARTFPTPTSAVKDQPAPAASTAAAAWWGAVTTLRTRR